MTSVYKCVFSRLWSSEVPMTSPTCILLLLLLCVRLCVCVRVYSLLDHSLRALLFGLTDQTAKEAVSSTCHSVVRHAGESNVCWPWSSGPRSVDLIYHEVKPSCYQGLFLFFTAVITLVCLCSETRRTGSGIVCTTKVCTETSDQQGASVDADTCRFLTSGTKSSVDQKKVGL